MAQCKIHDKNRSQCFCGNMMTSVVSTSESSCLNLCAGDSSQKCGGTWIMSLVDKEFIIFKIFV